MNHHPTTGKFTQTYVQVPFNKDYVAHTVNVWNTQVFRDEWLNGLFPSLAKGDAPLKTKISN